MIFFRHYLHRIPGILGFLVETKWSPFWLTFFAIFIFVIMIPFPVLADSVTKDGQGFMQVIGIGIIAATVIAYLSHILKQPLILAYIVAGAIIGPKMGLGVINDETSIKNISDIGLVLLLFMIGLEIDVKKLSDAGKSLVLSGIFQFLVCAIMGFGLFSLLNYSINGGKYNLVYIAVCGSLSSTAIVVKLLYEKFELDTYPGRLTLGILIFQDIWAIVILGIQPNLASPDMLAILLSFAKGGILVLISVLISKYFLGFIFKSIAKLPELVLVASLGWCFFTCTIADELQLSLEMGALIAGAAISTFPYNLDVIAKIVSIRDFFITLFFVSLGMAIPNPLNHPDLIGLAAILSLFVIFSRFVSLFPLLYSLNNGNRVSLLVPINLSQISEFSLVIAVIGVNKGHISEEILSVIIFAFAIMSIISTYMIKFSHQLQDQLNKALLKVGLSDLKSPKEEKTHESEKEIALLGFFRTASSLIRELEHHERELRDKIVVVDFNPNVFQTLNTLGIKVIYGDISHLETLRHAGIQNVRLAISSIPDTILKGTDNLKIIQKIRRICPHAKIIVTAESVSRALKMYNEGADYVMLPRILTASHLIKIIQLSRDGNLERLKKEEIKTLSGRQEIIS